MVLGIRGASGAADPRPAGVTTTLSGLAAGPYAERSVRVPAKGVGIRFRAPASLPLAAVHSFWRRAGEDCVVTIHADAGGAPAEALVGAPLPAEPGWTATPLAAPLVEGAHYHLVFTCATPGAPRLGYVLDATSDAVDGGAWRLEDLRGDRVRPRSRWASPLFALVLADGSWWGQPYRATGRRPTVRLCPSDEVRQTIVSSVPLTVAGVQLTLTADVRAELEFEVAAGDGNPLLAGALVRTVRGAGRRLFRPAVSIGTVTLAPDVPYTVTLRAPRAGPRCLRQRALTTDLPFGRPARGLVARDLRTSGDDGATWAGVDAVLGVTLITAGGPADPGEPSGGGGTPNVCGNGQLQSVEECDGPADTDCPGRCTTSCTCEPPPPACGDGVVQTGERCDGLADTACPGRCTTGCSCEEPPSGRTYRSIYASGYMGAYDAATVPVWPERLGLILGGVDVQGPIVKQSQERARATGNVDARFIFYFSLTDMDSRCGCYDQRFYESFRSSHPEWILRNAGGGQVSTSNGIGRLWATDIGNPAYVDAWADYALATADSQGWDGVFADNIFRGRFDEWSATPVNPRTGAAYAVADYRRDMLAALKRLRERFHARGKFVLGNHTQAWVPETFADPVIQESVTTMDGVEIEDCLFTYGATPHPETAVLSQLRYLDYANRRGVRTICNGPLGSIGNSSRRDYLLAFTLLTKEAFSSVSELNTVGQWWSQLTLDLGTPGGGYYCLDPARGFAMSSDCPSAGKILGREWEKGRVLVNPSASATVTVPLGGTFLHYGNPKSSVTLGPRSGAVLVRP
jgi:hypothetical protein